MKPMKAKKAVKTKKDRKPVKKTKPVKQKVPVCREVAEYYVCDKMWDAIDRSIAMHGKEPTSENCYHAIQLEGGRSENIDALIECLDSTMKQHYGFTIDDAENHAPLETVIDDIYNNFADEVVHLYLNEPKYLKPAENICPDCGEVHDEEDIITECEECGAEPAYPEDLLYYGSPDLGKSQVICDSCFDDKPNVWWVKTQMGDTFQLIGGYVFDSEKAACDQAKALSVLNKGRVFYVFDAKNDILEEGMVHRFIEDAPLVMPGKESKSGAFTQLAMFGGCLLGAGLANAAMHSAPSVRAAETPLLESGEVVEAVKEASK